MKALDRKLVRDLGRLRGQIVTIALVVACGIASYVAVVGTYVSLERARDLYYEAQRFGDAFVDVTRAPTTLRARIEAVPGVLRAATRLRWPLRLPVTGLIDPVRGVVESIDARRPAALDAVHLVAGRLPAPGRTDEVALLESFATAHGIALGQRLPIVLAGVRSEPRVVGIAMSPDYVFPIAAGEMVFDPARFGVVFMDAAALERALHMEGAFTHASVRLERDASLPAVTRALDRLLAPYGGRLSHGRDKHPSHALLDGELTQLRSLATFVPLIFLGVAAFLVNVVLARLVQLERPEIAALKAMGYRDRQLGLHYVKLVSVIVLLGGALGIGFGAYIGDLLADLYTEYFRFPDLSFRLDAVLVLQALLVSLVSAFAGAWVSARAVMRLPPAEAMRPPEPLVYRRSTSRFHGARLFGTSAAMVLREISRRPVRTVLSSMGIAMAVAVLVLGRFSYDAIQHLMDIQFRRSERQDVTVTFTEALERRAVAELAHLPHVDLAEGIRSVPVRVHGGHAAREAALTALRPDLSLRRVVDAEGRELVVPDDGVVLTRKLAEILRAEPGSFVEIESLEGAPRMRALRVADTVDDLFGLNVYMSEAALARFLGETPRVSAVLLRVDMHAYDALVARLSALPRVLGITSLASVLEHFEAQSAEQMRVMTLILTLFAATIAAGVVYNNARVSLSQRARDLASLRVLGFRRSEISAVLLGELALQTLLSLPPGMWIGSQLAAQMMSAADPEIYRFPLVISARTYAFAIAVTLSAALASALLVRRRLDRLDLIAVLKTRE